MIRECREYGLPEPKLIDFEGDFRVNMYRKSEREFGVNVKATQTHQTLVHDKPTMTQKEYALELGWTVDRVKYYLRKMKTQQIIKKVGSSHNGYWELLKDKSI